MAYDSRAVANAILDIGKKKNISMSMMKLLKLVFFAHGWCLGLLGRPLCYDRVEAWRYGPVFPMLYNSLPYKGSEIVNKPIVDDFVGEPITAEFEPIEQQLMEEVVEKYGRFNAFQLSEITHREGSPWSQVCWNGFYAPISNEIIKEYYEKRATENRKNRS